MMNVHTPPRAPHTQRTDVRAHTRRTERGYVHVRYIRTHTFTASTKPGRDLMASTYPSIACRAWLERRGAREPLIGAQASNVEQLNVLFSAIFYSENENTGLSILSKKSSNLSGEYIVTSGVNGRRRLAAVRIDCRLSGEQMSSRSGTGSYLVVQNAIGDTGTGIIFRHFAR